MVWVTTTVISSVIHGAFCTVPRNTTPARCVGALEVILYATGDARRPSPWESTISIGNYNGNLRSEFISDPPRVVNPSERNLSLQRRKCCLRHVRREKEEIFADWKPRLLTAVRRQFESKFETKNVGGKCNFTSSFLDSLVRLI